LSAAEYGNLQLPLVAREAKPVEHLADAQFIVIATGALKGFLRRAVLGQQLVGVRLGHAVLQVVQPRLLFAQPGEDCEHLVVDGVVAPGKGIDRFLAQIADLCAARQRHAARGRLCQPGQHAQQRRFADAVRADQANLAVVGN
jgi:hypothetical protein